MVGGALEVVLVADVVLNGGTDEPNGTLGLGHETVAAVEGDLAVAIKIVVGGPDPGTLRARDISVTSLPKDVFTYLEVGGGGRGQMDTHVVGEAGLESTGTGARALGSLELRASLSTDAVGCALDNENLQRTRMGYSHQVRVPHTGSTLLASGIVDVPLNNDGTGG